ncbi:UNVERIFIED_CONTAM: hypothetical protein K2H54_038100 [Gekko kuhli]
MLAAEDTLAHGGHIDLDRWRHDVAVVRQEERQRREQRHQEHMLRARRALVTWQRWWRAVQRDATAPEPMVRLRRPDGTWATHPREMADVMGGAFGQLVDRPGMRNFDYIKARKEDESFFEEFLEEVGDSEDEDPRQRFVVHFRAQGLQERDTLTALPPAVPLARGSEDPGKGLLARGCP